MHFLLPRPEGPERLRDRQPGSRRRRCAPAIAALWLACVATPGVPVPVFAQSADEQRPPAGENEGDIAYTVSIEGDMDSGLSDMLRSASQLVALNDDPPRTFSGLLRRTEQDRDRMLEVLQSEGFYDAAIETDIDDDQAPARVTISVETGPVYVLESYDLVYEPAPAADSDLPQGPDDFDLTIGMPARAPAIADARGAIPRRLAEAGHPLAKITDHKVIVDHDTETMRVTVTIDPGQAARFGPLAVEGLDEVEEDYVRKLVPWTTGDRWDRREVEAFRSRLAATNLFDGIGLDPADETRADGELPLTADLIEAKHRSIGAGARYSSDKGFSANAFWEHRNLLGENENLRLSTTAGQTEQSASADFIKPEFLQLDQNLLLNATARRQVDDAFDEQTLELFGGLEREMGNWRLRAGPAFNHSIVTDASGEETYKLLGLPVSTSYDGTDDLLDPTKGLRFSASATPWHDLGQPLDFLVMESTASTYVSFDEDDRFVFAVRGRVGSIVGARQGEIPANKRLYAGGGGSVRGYPYRSLGPLDAENDPVGGRSVVEAGMEMRVKITEDIGLVPFVEGGNVYATSTPDSLTDLRWAAGLGARYYTGIGPLRVDVAVPLDKRPGVDDSFEFYVSIGQAF